MPTPLIINLAKRRKIKVSKVEEYWDKAKEIALKKFKKKDPSYYPFVVGIVKRMCGLSHKAVASDDVTRNVDLIVPRRVQVAVNHQIYKVLKPLFERITSGQSLPRGMACHSLCFKYLVTKNNDLDTMVMLYRYNTVDKKASMLAHSVICNANKIVYDPQKSEATEIVNDTYLDTKTDSILYVAVRLNIEQIEALLDGE